MATKSAQRPASYPEYAFVDLEKASSGIYHEEATDFADRHLRLGFIRKVFGAHLVFSPHALFSVA